MFRRFRPKIRVYVNHRHGCSFKATFNWLIWNDVELRGLQTCYSGCSKFWTFRNISKIFNIFFLFQNCYLKNNFVFKKTYYMLEGNGWLICVQNVKSISSKMAEILHKTCKKVTSHVISGLYRDFPNFLFDRFWRCKRCLRVIFRVLCENLT